ncbi:hypothetical protein [uncultured Aquimarina sp.]|uniref:hypothetical protein n=1 Tax=uncultured Aquimarina sp. TaxID=575652 RepID=UPI0026239C9B|nr:hypothetical protein [uncultured Aquimarina sp.]
MMKLLIKILLFFISILLLQSCKSVDLRSDYLVNNPDQADTKGRELLETSMKKMGYDKFSNTDVYEVTAQFNWKKGWLVMPMNAFPGNNKNDLQFRFATNTFDGQLEYLEGRKKGIIQGLQSWQGYKTSNDKDRFKKHQHDRYIWGLATYHYILESPFRMLEATVIRYAGEKEFENKQYDLVYATWGSEAPNNQYDRWLIYINKETGFIDLTEVTINDFFITMPKGLQHGTVRFDRRETSIGTYLPSKVSIQLLSPKKEESYVYYFTLSEYKFDEFNKDLLYPLEGLPLYGNSKPNEAH